jgi:hypothetical protein
VTAAAAGACVVSSLLVLALVRLTPVRVAALAAAAATSCSPYNSMDKTRTSV